jgi:hypothetical protein
LAGGAFVGAANPLKPFQLEDELTWLVDVEFRTSPVHGTGIFARRAIKAGNVIWRYDEAMHACDQKTMAALSPRTIAYALHGGYLHQPSGKFLWYEDGMQFMNHGEGEIANVGLAFWPALQEDHTVALRDIGPGEELREDYGFWANGGLAPDHWLNPLYRQHCPGHMHFLRSLSAQDARVAA